MEGVPAGCRSGKDGSHCGSKRVVVCSCFSHCQLRDLPTVAQVAHLRLNLLGIGAKLQITQPSTEQLRCSTFASFDESCACYVITINAAISSASTCVAA